MSQIPNTPSLISNIPFQTPTDPNMNFALFWWKAIWYVTIFKTCEEQKIFQDCDAAVRWSWGCRHLAAIKLGQPYADGANLPPKHPNERLKWVYILVLAMHPKISSAWNAFWRSRMANIIHTCLSSYWHTALATVDNIGTMILREFWINQFFCDR